MKFLQIYNGNYTDEDIFQMVQEDHLACMGMRGEDPFFSCGKAFFYSYSHTACADFVNNISNEIQFDTFANEISNGKYKWHAFALSATKPKNGDENSKYWCIETYYLNMYYNCVYKLITDITHEAGNCWLVGADIKGKKISWEYMRGFYSSFDKIVRALID